MKSLFEIKDFITIIHQQKEPIPLIHPFQEKLVKRLRRTAAALTGDGVTVQK